MLSLGHVVISDLVVADLFMHSLSGMSLLYLAMPFTLKVFLHDRMYILTCDCFIRVLSSPFYHLCSKFQVDVVSVVLR